MMHLVRCSLVVAVCSWLASGPLAAQQDTLGLSLDQAVILALEHHLGLRSARLGPQIQQSAVRQEELRFARSLSAGLTHQASRSPSISRLEQVETSSSNGLQVNLGLAQDLPTGGSLSLDLRNNRSSSNAAFRLIDPVYQSDLMLRFTQPLLQGRGAVNRIGLAVARRQLEAAEVASAGQARDLTAEVGTAYWDLSMAHQSLTVKQQLLAGAQRLLENAQVRSELGAGPASGILQAQVAVAQRAQEIVAAEGSLRQADDQLGSLLGLDQDSPGAQRALFPTDAPEMVPFTGSYETDLAEVLAVHPAYRRAALELENLGLQIALARDQARPGVNLSTQVGLSGIGATYADNLDVVSETRGRSWQGGVGLVFPLGQTSAAARVQQRQLEQQQRRLDLEQLRLQLAQQLRGQLRRVAISRQGEEAARWTERLAEQSVVEEEERLALGLSTVRLVLDAQDELAKARLSRLQALVDYNKALVEWRKLTGQR